MLLWSRSLSIALTSLAVSMLMGCGPSLESRLENSCRDHLDLDIVDQALWREFQTEIIAKDAATHGVSYYDGWDFEGRLPVRSVGKIKTQKISLFRIENGRRKLVAKFDNYYVTRRRITHTELLDCFGHYPEAILSGSD